MFEHLLKIRYVTVVIVILAVLHALAFLFLGLQGAIGAYKHVLGDSSAAESSRPGLELLFAAWAGAPPPEILQRVLALGRAAGQAVLWRAPRGLHTSVEMVWGPPPADLPLMRRVKAALDPHGTLASGRFVGGL